MTNNFDVFLTQQIKEEVTKQLAEAKPKEIVKETTIIKENLEDSLKCLTVKQVSKFIGIGESDVRKLINAGALKAIKFRTIKVPAIELYRFLQDNVERDFTDVLG